MVVICIRTVVITEESQFKGPILLEPFTQFCESACADDAESINEVRVHLVDGDTAMLLSLCDEEAIAGGLSAERSVDAVNIFHIIKI